MTSPWLFLFSTVLATGCDMPSAFLGKGERQLGILQEAFLYMTRHPCQWLTVEADCEHFKFLECFSAVWNLLMRHGESLQ